MSTASEQRPFPGGPAWPLISGAEVNRGESWIKRRRLQCNCAGDSQCDAVLFLYWTIGQPSVPQGSPTLETPSSPSPLFPSPLLLLFHFKTPKQAAHRRPLTAVLLHPIDFCCLAPNHEEVRRCATHLSVSELSHPRPCPSCAGSPVCHHSSRATRTDPDVTWRQQLARVLFRR